MKQNFTKAILNTTLFIILIVTSLHVSAQVNLSSGLVAYYPFSGNANDSSGNKNNPIFNNATLTTDRFGNANSAYRFNGSNYIDIPNSASLRMGTKASISFWVKISGFNTGV